MRRFLAAVPLILAGLAPHADAQDVGARVSVYGTHQGGNVIYHYQVRNNGPGEIRRFYVGCDCRSPEDTGKPELQMLPVNARASRTDDFGTWYDLPPEAATHPAGWRVRLLRPHGASGHWLEWFMPAAAKPGIAPGATADGFSVTVPGTDETYLLGRYSVHWQGAKTAAAAASAGLLLADTTPPKLSLTTSALSDEPGATAQVRVNVVATDDRDLEPRVMVESVGRPDDGVPAYIVRYSATDASGNRATATARVALPAEREIRAPAQTLLRRASLP